MGKTGALEALGAFYMMALFIAAMFVISFILYHTSRHARKLLDYYIIEGEAWEDE